MLFRSLWRVQLSFPVAWRGVLVLLCRYDGPLRQRILRGTNVNWLSGHYGWGSFQPNGASGLAFRNPPSDAGWITATMVGPVVVVVVVVERACAAQLKRACMHGGSTGHVSLSVCSDRIK